MEQILFEKLIVAQLIKKLPVLYVHYRVYKTPPLDTTLNQMNSVHTLTTHFLRLILILLSRTRLGLPLSSLQVSRLKHCISYFSHSTRLYPKFSGLSR